MSARVRVTSSKVEVPRSYSSQKRGIRSERTKEKKSMNSCVQRFMLRAKTTPPKSKTMFFMKAKIGLFRDMRKRASSVCRIPGA